MNSSIQYLLDNAKDGDKSAINSLMECKRNYLRHVVNSRLDRKIRRRLDISDVIQEILLVASTRLKNYLSSPALPFEYWLKQIANDKIVDAYRQHRAAERRSVDKEHVAMKNHSVSDRIMQLTGPSSTPGACVVQKEIQQEVELAIDALKPCDAEIIRMRHFEFHSNREVASRLGISDASASVRYVRALKRLRVLLSSKGCT